MKYTLLSLCLLAALSLAGCSSRIPEEYTGVSQAIQTDSSSAADSQSQLSQTSPSAASADSSSTASGTVNTADLSSMSLEELLSSYYNAKAEEEAADLDLDLLEQQYRIGQLDDATFQQQKADLKQAETQWEQQADAYKAQIRAQGGFPQPDLGDTSDTQALWEKAAQREQQEDQLDSQEDTLERDYRSGTISREELVEKLAELERQKMELDALEDALERLGIDD